MKKQCQAITQNGHQCNNLSQNGLNTCNIRSHIDQFNMNGGRKQRNNNLNNEMFDLELHEQSGGCGCASGIVLPPISSHNKQHQKKFSQLGG